MEFFCATPSIRSSCSKPLRPRVPRRLPPESLVVKTMPLSVNVDAGRPCSLDAARKVSTTIGPVTRWWAVTDMAVLLAWGT